MYLGRKESTEYNVGESVVLNLATSSNYSYCTQFEKKRKRFKALELSEQIGKTCQHFRQTKNPKRGDCKFKTCKNLICVKWMDNQAVTLIGSDVDDLKQISSVLRRQKGSSSKSAVPSPITVKKYNQSMGGVDLCDQYTAAYHLVRRSKFRFSLLFFFDLYDKLHLNGLSFLDFNDTYKEKLSLIQFSTRMGG